MKDGLKLEQQADGKYCLTLRDGNIVTIKKDLTMQEVVYELEMRMYQNEHIGHER